MNFSYHSLLKKIKSIYLQKMIPPLLLFGAVAYLALSYPFASVINPDSIASLPQLTAEDQGGYFQISADTLYYTGYDYQLNGKNTGGIYYTLQDDSCYFFVLSDKTDMHRQSELSGVTVSVRCIPADFTYRRLIRDFSADLGWTEEGLAEVSFPYMLSELHYQLPRQLALLAGLLFLLLFCVLTFFVNLFYCMVPGRSPGMRLVSRKSSFIQELYTFAKEASDDLLYLDHLMITEHYFWYCSRHRALLLPVEDILWVYTHNTILPFGANKKRVSFHLRIVSLSGKNYDCIIKSKEDTDAVLIALKRLNPDIYIGLTEKNRKIVRAAIAKMKK